MTIRTTAIIRDQDRGMRVLLRAVGLGGKTVDVGILGAKARAPSKRNGKATVGEIAGWLEYGNGRNPARPVIGPYFDRNRSANLAFARELAQRRVLGTMTSEQSLMAMGARSVGGIQRAISLGVPPPNAPSTIRRKGSSKPWIDTGQTRSSFAYRVNK